MDKKQSPHSKRDLMVYAIQEEITDAVEAERKRISDKLGQTIITQINLILSQTATYQHSTHNVQQAQMALSVISTLLRQLLQSTLDFQSDLHPVIIETLGLEAALEALSTQTLRTHGIRMDVRFDHPRDRLSNRLGLSLLRLTQTILDTFIKQGKTSQITIHTLFNEDMLTYRMTGNGQVTLDDIWETVQQRVHQLGGTITNQTGDYQLMVDMQFRLEIPPQLTDREQMVVTYLAEGLTNREIAYQLEISPNTVKFHLDNLYSKLNVNSRTEAVVYALRHGWVNDRLP